MLTVNKGKARGSQGSPGGARHLRAFPEGPRRELTDEWKLRVRAAMRNRRNGAGVIEPMSDAQLASALGVTRSLVYKLLKPIDEGGQQVSALVPKICELLQIAPPTEPPRDATPRDERHARLDAIVAQMTDEQVDSAIQFLQSILNKK